MKILLAIDDSPFTEASIQALIAQFDPAKTEVRVINVVEPITVSAPPQMDPQYYPELREQIKEVQTLVDRVAKKLQGAGFRVSSAVEKGDARSAIVDAATAWKSDLIVLGSHGRKGLSRFLLGSVSEAVARHAPCSVEIVRMPAAS
jgi:nucleotide-binding universal stress UspA family protein